MSTEAFHSETGQALAAFSQTEHIPGAVLGIVREGRLEHLSAFGATEAAGGTPVGSATRFRIASMTKCFTALAILSLRDEGRLRLDDPVTAHVPSFAAWPLPTRDSPPPTIRDLLTHRAGLVTDDPWADRRLGMPEHAFEDEIARGFAFAQSPGLSTEYSNLAYAVLGTIVRRASGEAYQDYVRRLLLGPLGMASSGFQADAPDLPPLALGHAWAAGADGAGRWTPEPADPDGAFASIGGLVTNAQDYARFVAFLLSAWPPRDDPDDGPVSRATVREIAAGHGHPDLRASADFGLTSASFGFGMACCADEAIGPFLTHSGGLPGYGSNVLLLPGSGVGVFAFANNTYAPMHAMTRRVAARLRAAGMAVPRAAVPSAALTGAIGLVLEACRTGTIRSLGRAASENLLRDRSAERRDEQIARLNARCGTLRLGRIEPRNSLAARFVLVGETSEVTGALSLTPEPEPRIQALDFDDAVATAPSK